MILTLESHKSNSPAQNTQPTLSYPLSCPFNLASRWDPLLRHSVTGPLPGLTKAPRCVT